MPTPETWNLINSHEAREDRMQKLMARFFIDALSNFLSTVDFASLKDADGLRKQVLSPPPVMPSGLLDDVDSIVSKFVCHVRSSLRG